MTITSFLPRTAFAARGGARRRLMRQPTFALAAAWLALVLVAAAAPGLLTRYDPYAIDEDHVLAPMSAAHWFGTDQFGRDTYARVVYGTVESLKAAVLAVLIGLVVGSLIGLLSGFVAGKVDTAVMRLVDTMLAIPALILSLAILTTLGPGTISIGIAIGVNSIASIARLMRSEVLSVKERAYVEASRFFGHGMWYRLGRHVIPNASGSVLTAAILDIGTAILGVASLSFLGLGAPPPTPEWGSLVAEGRGFFPTQWWMSILPGAVIAVSVLSVYKVARVLRNSRSANIA
ncbi:ABC transporter permease [Phytohabitans sp. ZYX-F-186]|uniref:ABC transporter permease n=1 Tax=Phytohabitans maris TaxID=3071409 RepID=A0ABU0ZK22_9ACTN|nr:ABC transporter permease [Phytohabitans sp. ZYX-F-186]MDQ7907398.1 ABC transporter permease [Phytohabitans sp. ZYX-F-186]